MPDLFCGQNTHLRIFLDIQKGQVTHTHTHDLHTNQTIIISFFFNDTQWEPGAFLHISGQTHTHKHTPLCCRQLKICEN